MKKFENFSGINTDVKLLSKFNRKRFLENLLGNLVDDNQPVYNTEWFTTETTQAGRPTKRPKFTKMGLSNLKPSSALKIVNDSYFFIIDRVL